MRIQTNIIIMVKESQLVFSFFSFFFFFFFFFFFIYLFIPLCCIVLYCVVFYCIVLFGIYRLLNECRKIFGTSSYGEDARAERVHMARTHELASASPPYEPVPNILRYSFNNLFYYKPFIMQWNGFICLFLAPPGLIYISFGHILCKKYRFERLMTILLHTRCSAFAGNNVRTSPST